MEARYTIEVEPARDLVRITLAGFFSPADVERFLKERTAAQDRLRTKPNAHLTLCDITAMNIQTQDIVGAFAQIISHPRLASRRLAIVASSSLARMQSKRATGSGNVAHFTDLAEAEAWLLS